MLLFSIPYYNLLTTGEYILWIFHNKTFIDNLAKYNLGFFVLVIVGREPKTINTNTSIGGLWYCCIVELVVRLNAR